MAADIVGHLVKLGHDFVFGEADQPFAEAVAAVHGAEVGGQKQRGLGVFVLQAAHFSIALFAGGIKTAFGGNHLHAAGHGHFADGIIGVVGINQRQIIAGYGHRVSLDDGGNTLLFFFCERQILGQLGSGGDIVFEFFLPSHKNSSFIYNKRQLIDKT